MNNIKIGTSRITSGAHYGWKDWLIQRITGVLILIFVVAILARFMTAPAGEVNFETWHGFMTCLPMKFLTFFALLAVCYHAWIGVRDIWMDYVRNTGVRLVLHVFTFLWLLGCAAFGISALWN